jgi:hypothetical protein
VTATSPTTVALLVPGTTAVCHAHREGAPPAGYDAVAVTWATTNPPSSLPFTLLFVSV